MGERERERERERVCNPLLKNDRNGELVLVAGDSMLLIFS